jgi:hypothetical protein
LIAAGTAPASTGSFLVTPLKYVRPIFSLTAENNTVLRSIILLFFKHFYGDTIMASLNKEILGKVKGSLGDVTFRQRNGKTFVSARPSSFVPGTDENSKARREKFSMVIKLAQSIYSVRSLKEIWSEYAPQGASVFNYITQTNYPMMNADGLTSLVKLVPSLGFNVGNPVVTLGPEEVKVNLDALGNAAGIDAAGETSLMLISLVYLSGPSDASFAKSQFLTLASGSKATDLAAPLEFTIALSNVESQMLALYQIRKAYFTLLTLDAADRIVHYSNTFVG